MEVKKWIEPTSYHAKKTPLTVARVAQNQSVTKNTIMCKKLKQLTPKLRKRYEKTFKPKAIYCFDQKSSGIKRKCHVEGVKCSLNQGLNLVVALFHLSLK